MDVDASGSGRGPNTGARSGASGVGSGNGANSVAGGSTSVPNITWIRPSQPSKNSTVTLRKLITYGYSVENIQPESSTTEHVTTSLGLIPVDYLPWYISDAEWQALPFSSEVHHVSTDITPLGTRTAFDVGTTLSGTATSEYVPIGVYCIGMNKKFYGQNKNYTVESTNPMKPTGINDINIQEMMKKYYEHVKSNALCVPQSIDEYYVHEWNRSENPDTHKYPQYQEHKYGCVRMDEKVHQFLINQAVGQNIIHYEYMPKNGLIKSAKDHFVPYDRRNNSVETHLSRPTSIALQFFTDSGTRKPAIGDVGLQSSVTNYVLINQIAENYFRKIENYGTFHPSRGVEGFEAQPQLHIGILATPQLNPSTSQNVTYLNSCCYWKVETSITIKINLNSAFSNNNAISWPLEVRFQPNTSIEYTSGQTLFGIDDSTTAKKSSLSSTQRRSNRKKRSVRFADMNINADKTSKTATKKQRDLMSSPTNSTESDISILDGLDDI